MKTLVLTPGVFDKGGIARYGRFQIRALREGFGAEAVRVMSLLGPHADDFEDPIEVQWHGSTPPTLLSRVRFAVASLRAALGQPPAAIVTQHVHLGPLAYLLARLSGARLIQNVYGLEIWSGMTRSRRVALTRSARVISDCHNTADMAVDLGLTPARPTVIWDCVDVDRYVPGRADPAVLARYGVPTSGRFRILFLARIDADARYKGSERLLQVLARLPSDRFEAVYAGKGNDVEHLRGLASRLGVVDRVTFTGSIHEAHMPDIYRMAHAFYLVSEAGPGKGEGIPLTPLEALSCGVPVLVGDQDGSREVIEGEGGCCSPPDDLATQASYLVGLASDERYRAREAEAARTRAESAFGYSAFAGKTIAAFSGLPVDPQEP